MKALYTFLSALIPLAHAREQQVFDSHAYGSTMRSGVLRRFNVTEKHTAKDVISVAQVWFPPTKPSAHFTYFGSRRPTILMYGVLGKRTSTFIGLLRHLPCHKISQKSLIPRPRYLLSSIRTPQPRRIGISARFKMRLFMINTTLSRKRTSL